MGYFAVQMWLTVRYLQNKMRTIGSKYLNLLGLLDSYVRFSNILRTYDVAPHTQDKQPGMGSQWRYL